MTFQRSRAWLGALAVVVWAAGAAPAPAQEQNPSVGNLFIQAYLDKNEAECKRLIQTRTAEFPAETQAMVEYAMSAEAPQKDQDFLFTIAGSIATMYKEHTGDGRLLAAVEGSYENLLKRRQQTAISAESVAKLQKDLLALGKGEWKIQSLRMDPAEGLIVEIDVRESTSGELTPRISMAVTQQAAAAVKKHLPEVKKGHVSWSSMGVGLKTAFLE